MKKYSCLLTFLMVCNVFSQNFKGQLEPVENKGLHKIAVPNNVRAACNDHFNFLRIKDSKNQEVPYVLMHSSDKQFSQFTAIPISSKKVIKDSVTSIVLENQEAKKRENIILKIANTNIIKSYDVFGSNNGKDWFGLVANKRLSYSNKTNSTVLEKTIDFPLNNYTFLRIDFNDKNTLPINILEAGFYKNKVFTQNPIEIKNYSFTTNTLKDKKVTRLTFTATKAHKIDFITFKIPTDFFLRDVILYTNKIRNVKKQSTTYKENLANFKLNSAYENTFYVRNVNAKEFVIEIDNQDNPPLEIESIQLLQKPVYLIANLKQKENYSIILDTLLQRPSYDLGNFISDKMDAIKETAITNFSEIKSHKTNTKPEKKFWQTTLFMWACIILGGALVVYFSIGLLKDIDSDK